MRKVGDYDWRQVSMWESTPENCIEKYIDIDTGLSKGTCHFYLRRITEIVSDNQWKTETVVSLDGVPDEVLSWRSNDYYLKTDRKSVKYSKEP